jgi:lysophospholipase L1-like esterase
VNVDDSGFRRNPNIPASGKRGVLLGGSAAFGHYASSDANTIGALLSAETGIGFVNRNAPSWNSHQELVALAKYASDYQISISFSLANDIGIFCEESDRENYTPGEPESFATLRGYFNDIRGAPLKELETQSYSLFSWVQSKVRAAFPDTARAIKKVVEHFRAKYDKSEEEHDDKDRCSAKDVGPLVDSFLRNETAMRQLSRARGAIHVLVIQPIRRLHATAKDGEEDGFSRAVIAEVLKSDFCKEYCLDFSTIFDQFGGATSVDENVGTHYRPRMFVDDVHPTDQGNSIIARELSRRLADLPIP